MRLLEDRLIGLLEIQLQVLKELHIILEQKTQVLMSSDLQRMEEKLQQENVVAGRGIELERSISGVLKSLSEELGFGTQPEWEVLASRVSPKALVRLTALKQALRESDKRIRNVKLKMAALIGNGLQFCNAMLEAICPAQTYDPTNKTSALPNRNVLSVEC